RNIYDLVRSGGKYVGLVEFLRRELLGPKHLVSYNRSEGITFRSDNANETERAFVSQMRIGDPLMSLEKLQALPRDPVRALPMIERFLLFGQQVAVVVSFLETIIPAGEIGYMSPDDRNNLVTLQRWISSSQLLNSDNIVIYVAENVADVHPRIREHSRLVTIEIPYPDEQERFEFIRYFNAVRPGVKSDIPDEQIAALTSGLNRIHLNSMLRSAQYEGGSLSFEAVREKKKAIIESECVGLVEFVTPRYGLDSVGGMSKPKEFLSRIAETIKTGNTEEAPMGILFSGPVGTGKTFLAECFAKDCGLNVVEIKNFREKWVGASEANLEKILSLLESLAPIVVLIDEADATLGTRDSGGGDSGVDARIFSKVAAAMGNTENRGRILWILMTSRPDLLPIDLKRQGRCEEHISLFYPDTEDDRTAILQAMIRKNKVEVTDGVDWSPIARSSLTLSGADIESMVIRCRREARACGRQAVSQDDVAKVAGEFTPARDEVAVEYQTLVAVREATSKEMVPEPYRSMTPAEISERIEALRPMVR
ncbi:MAG TPA: ATP-binding protein, partial [Blastocatellia bacterium]|nr:ATP-binding protein [Blastocatellia bacterium]